MTSFAKTVSPSGINAVLPRPAFDAGAKVQPPTDQGRGSGMVEKDRPAPAPHPSPDIAGGSDRAAFNARWEMEQREARKAAFIQKRTEGGALDQARSFNMSANSKSQHNHTR